MRSFYHKIRPLLIRIGPSNSFMRIAASLVINVMAREHKTKVIFSSQHIDIIKEKKIIRLNPKHWIYALSLSKDFSAYVDCVEPQKINNYELVDYSKVHLQKFKLSGLEFEVASFPEEEKAILDYFKWYTPQKGDTVFDLGANCGLSVYYLSKSVGESGKVYAFEPDPINFEILLRNIKRHGLDNVIPHPKAIASENGFLEFFSEGTIGSTLARQSNRTTTGKILNVESISLQNACYIYGVPSFIKMDIEGAEIEVINASRELLQKNSIHFAIDTNHYKNGILTCLEIEKIFSECGYEVSTSSESGFATTWARKVNA